MCFCFPGFKGDDCSQIEICKNNCSNNGICVNEHCVCKDIANKNEDCSTVVDTDANNDTSDSRRLLKRDFDEMKFREVDIGSEDKEFVNNSELQPSNNNFREEVNKLMSTIVTLIILIVVILIFVIFNKKKII
jgi:hypothetical protein